MINQIRKRVLSLVKTGAVIQAVTAAAEFVRRNPEQAEGYGLLSQAEEIAGYTRAAIKTVAHAVALAPHEPAYRFQRGRLHLRVNEIASALEDMAAVIEMEQRSGNACYTDAACACRDEAVQRLATFRGTTANHSLSRRSCA